MQHTTRTQAGIKDKGLYSSLYEQVEDSQQAEQGLSGFAGGRGQQNVRTQAGVRKQGLYKHLFPQTEAVEHPYLPYSVKQQAKGLSGYLGQAAQKTAPGLMVALGLAIAYFLFFRKKNESEESEIEEEAFVEEEFEPELSSARSKYYF